MGSFKNLINYLNDTCLGTLSLSFSEIRAVSGLDVDSNFMNRKKELENYGFSVVKVNLGSQTVLFSRINKTREKKYYFGDK